MTTTGRGETRGACSGLLSANIASFLGWLVVAFGNAVGIASEAEIYDIRKDPKELDDLRDTLGVEGDRLHALAREYALSHSRRPKPTP